MCYCRFSSRLPRHSTSGWRDCGCGEGALLTFIRTVAETGSTNTDLLAAAAAGEPEGSWLRAERQTAGKGRLGRNWQEFEGNLYCSTIVRPLPNDPEAATLGFVAAVALDQVLRRHGPQVDFQIKWPNDILASGAKLSGILLERVADAVVVGIGVNLADHPKDLDRATTSMRALTGTAPDPADFLGELADAFAHWLSRWRNVGLGAVMERWSLRAYPLGTALTANLPDGDVVSGQFDGLDKDAALKLRLADGTIRVIHAGDVFLV